MKDRRLLFIVHFPRKLKLTQINCDVKVSKMISYQLYMGNDKFLFREIWYNNEIFV